VAISGLVVLVVAGMGLPSGLLSAAKVGVVQTFGGAGSGPATSLSVSPSTATVAGDLLVATVEDRAQGPAYGVSGITDSAGNTWVEADAYQLAQNDEEIWYAADAASVGPGGSVTVTLTGAAATAVTVLEVAGAAASPLDSIGSDGGTSSSATTGPTTSTSRSDVVVIGDIGWNRKGAAGATTSGFTTAPQQQTTAAPSVTSEVAGWEVTSSPATESFAMSLAASVTWTGVIATFDTATTPPPTPTPTPISVVQTFGAATSAYASSLSASPTSPTATGDLLVAVIQDRHLGGYDTVSGVSDSAGNGWTEANEYHYAQFDQEVWYAPVTTSLGTGGSVTVKTISTSSIAFTVLEVAGAAPKPDAVSGASGTGTDASTSAMATSSSGEDMVVGDIGWSGDDTPSGQTAGYTPTPTEQSSASNAATGEQAAWDVLSSPGTYQYAATLSQSVTWTASMVAFASGSGTSSPTPSTTPTTSPSPSPTPSASPTTSPVSGQRHVMVIMEENRGYKATLGTCSSDPYLCTLASDYASYTDWYAISHPSLPNYFAIDSGSTQGCSADSCPGPYSATDLGGQLSSAGIPWTAYMESMPSPCYSGSSGLYVEHHNPFVYFQDVLDNGCTSHVIPYPGVSTMVSQLDSASAPDFVWITPNLDDDMHNGTVAEGNSWLQANLPQVLSSSWFTGYDSAIIITMDENDMQSTPMGGQIPMVVISAHAAGQGQISSSGNLYGTLRAIEEAFGLSYLGAASDSSNGDPIGSF
jgi:phosphatidylinositol-3-phosphatase